MTGFACCSDGIIRVSFVCGHPQAAECGHQGARPSVEGRVPRRCRSARGRSRHQRLFSGAKTLVPLLSAPPPKASITVAPSPITRLLAAGSALSSVPAACRRAHWCRRNNCCSGSPTPRCPRLAVQAPLPVTGPFTVTLSFQLGVSMVLAASFVVQGGLAARATLPVVWKRLCRWRHCPSPSSRRY